MNVNFEHYKIFYYVAKYRNITKAAAALGSNQPNVTRIIKLLEAQLNCRLFVREPRGMSLTEAGERLYSHVELACQHLLCAEAEMDRGFDGRGVVEIGVTETALHLYLLQTLHDFKEQYPEIRIKIHNHTTPEILKALISGKVDFAVVTTPFQSSAKFSCEKILEFEEVLVGGMEYADIARKGLTWEELCRYSLIGLGRGTATYEFYQNLFIERHMDFELDMEVATSDLIIPLIQSNLGIGFVAEALAEPLLSEHKVVQIELDKPVPKREIQMISDRERGKSRAADMFYKYLAKTAASLFTE